MPMDKEQLKRDVAQSGTTTKSQPSKPTQPAPTQPAGELMTMDALQRQITQANVDQLQGLADFGRKLAVRVEDNYALVAKSITTAAVQAGFSGFARGVQEALSECGMATMTATSDPLDMFDTVDTTIEAPKLPQSGQVKRMLGAG